MPGLARRWSELVLADLKPGQHVPPVVQETCSVLRPPATEAQVERAQQRMGKELSPRRLSPSRQRAGP
jgi:hypothetical protein